VADGVIERIDFKEILPKVEYSLMPLGRSMTVALGPLCEWGSAHTGRWKP
jgi:DNA-binding HxlR family transcriptional regulator